MAQIDDDLFVISGIVGASGYPTAIPIMERICAYIKDVQNSSHNSESAPVNYCHGCHHNRHTCMQSDCINGSEYC